MCSSNSDFNPITETFHLLQSVEQVYGATPVEDKFEYTIYSIVYDISKKAVGKHTVDSLTAFLYENGRRKIYIYYNTFCEKR